MSLRQAAQKAWKGTKRLQANTLGQLQARSTQMRQAVQNSRARVGFVLKLMAWRKRSDTRGVAARLLLATMPKMLAPTITMKITSVEDAKRVRQELVNWSKYERTSTHEMKARWTKVLRFLNHSKSSSDNQVQLYADGSEAFLSMWSAIRNAKKRVWITTYILKPDAVGLKMIEELTEAARRGVQVAFIYDHFGSFGFSDVYFEDLRAAGGTVLCFNSITSIANFFRFDLRSNYVLYRNHRKVLIVDNDVGFCGGMNIAGDYCGEDIGGNGRFRDTHARIVGPGVVHLAEVFISTLQTMQKQNIEGWPEIMKRCLAKSEELPPPSIVTRSSIVLPRTKSHPTFSSKVTPLKVVPKSNSASFDYQEETPNENDFRPVVERLVTSSRSRAVISPPSYGSFLQVLSSNSRENKRAIQKALAHTIDLAQKHVYLTSPYFLPPLQIRQAIIRAARRGVDVRILTAGKSDIYLITSASAHIYGIFLKNGVRIYELNSQELHAKVVSSDGAVAMVGSYNLDNLSYKHNLETNLNLVDSHLATQLEKQFFEDLKSSSEVIKDIWEDRSIFAKAWHWLVYTAFSLLLR